MLEFDIGICANCVQAANNYGDWDVVSDNLAHCPRACFGPIDESNLLTQSHYVCATFVPSASHCCMKIIASTQKDAHAHPERVDLASFFVFAHYLVPASVSVFSRERRD